MLDHGTAAARGTNPFRKDDRVRTVGPMPISLGSSLIGQAAIVVTRSILPEPSESLSKIVTIAQPSSIACLCQGMRRHAQGTPTTE